MPKRRTRKRIIGGNPAETKFREYASKIANKEPVSIESFSAFLDSVDDPLKVAIDYDKTGKPYTINEYALLHNASHDIHAVFWKYEVALNHTADYSAYFDIKPALTILEAYILHGLHSRNIRNILDQISTKSTNSLFRYIPETRNIPTVFFFALQSSNYSLMPLSHYVYSSIITLYTQPQIYLRLTNNNTFGTVLELLNIAIRFNKPDLMEIICSSISSSENIYKLLFRNSTLTFLLLQNNPLLFTTAFNLLIKIDQTEVEKYINQYGLHETVQIIEKYTKRKTSPSPTDAKRFFELLGRHTLHGILEPYAGSKVRIIIRCHGVLAAESKRIFDFPFSRLCYFISKGQTLGEACFVSNRTENMICNGNYDDNLQCVESVNGEISSEPMKFLFDSGFFLGTRNRYTGIYVCREGSVDRADELDIQEDTPYSLENIVGFCNAVCRERQIDPANVDILLFSCRTRLGNPKEVVQVNPKLVAKI
jgi:hypothetical protein